MEAIEFTSYTWNIHESVVLGSEETVTRLELYLTRPVVACKFRKCGIWERSCIDKGCDRTVYAKLCV